MSPHKWGGVGSSLIALAFIASSWIYLTGDINTASGRFAYDLADFLAGPVLAASLVLVTYVLRERLAAGAPRRMDLALLASVLAALGFAAVAFLRASNRHYHLLHPELALEQSQTVLIVWTTLVGAANSLGFHFLGWVYVLVGSASWTTRQMPRLLSLLYLIAGAAGWFVYLQPELEGLAILLSAVIGTWQAALLWTRDRTQPHHVE